MEKGGASAMDMDAAASSQDMWDWEVLPDHMSSSSMDSKLASSPHGGHGRSLLEDQEAEEPNLTATQHAADADMDADECKDIGVVAVAPEEEDKASQEEPMPTEAEPLASDGEGEDEEETFQSSDAKGVDGDGDGDGEAEAAAEEAPLVFAGGEGEDEAGKRKGSRAGGRPEYCAVFGVGKLRVNGIGALCSFGVAAAAVCILLAGGRPPQQEKKKIQLQFYADDKRMHQVVQQTSRLNQAMSSLMGGSGSPRANISFGGYYDGF